MTLTTLALRNTFRNRTRAFLTMGGVAVLTVAFVFLRTIVSSYYSGREQARTDRLVVRNRVSFIVPLPVAYFEKIQAVPGVAAVTYSNWFGGTYIDSRHFFARFAVDPDTYFEVYNEIKISPDDLAAFKSERTVCLVGTGLAERYGFKKGDVIHLKGDIYPGDWAFTVRGTFTGNNNFVSNSMYIPWKTIDQSLPEARRGQAGMYAVLVKNPDESPQIAKAIDAVFANSANETQSESEQAFTLSMMAGSATIVHALEVISLVLLVIMLLILGNTLAMAVRERTGELAVLRTLGFRPRQLLALCLSEGLLLSALGGLLGILLTRPVIAGFVRVASGFMGVPLPNRWTGPALLTAVIVGLLAAAIPSIQAARVDIVTALRRTE
jgi:putative ABC transport system permease protein